MMMEGGWKGREGKISKADLYRRLYAAFGIAKGQIRDTYGITDIQAGMIDANTIKHMSLNGYISQPEISRP